MNDPKKTERNEICGVRNGFACSYTIYLLAWGYGIFVIFLRAKKVHFFQFVLIAIFISLEFVWVLKYFHYLNERNSMIWFA